MVWYGSHVTTLGALPVLDVISLGVVCAVPLWCRPPREKLRSAHTLSRGAKEWRVSMGPTTPTPEPYWTSERREIRGWLSRNGASSLAELYAGAVMLVGLTAPGRVRLVAHAVREIRSRLPDVLAPEEVPKRLDYHKECKTIRALWPQMGPLLQPNGPSASPTTTGTVTIPAAAAVRVQQLLTDDLEVEGRVRETARRLYVAAIRVRSSRVLTDSEAAVIEPAIRQWLEVTDWFVGLAHDNGKADAATDPKEFEHRFHLFERGLLALIQDFYPALEDLDEILEEANS
jgi:hypothetical protein